MISLGSDWIWRICIGAVIIINGVLQDEDLHRIDMILKTLHPK